MLGIKQLGWCGEGGRRSERLFYLTVRNFIFWNWDLRNWFPWSARLQAPGYCPPTGDVKICIVSLLTPARPIWDSVDLGCVQIPFSRFSFASNCNAIKLVAIEWFSWQSVKVSYFAGRILISIELKLYHSVIELKVIARPSICCLCTFVCVCVVKQRQI